MSQYETQGYPPKEKAVYEAVLRLIAQGISMEKLTVQQIAQEAGIGKGTVYEYFSAREEIFQKTILYRMRQETQTLEQALHAADSFAQKCDALMKELEQAAQSRLSSAQILLANMHMEELRMLLGKDMPLCDLFAVRLRALMLEVLDCGVSEHVIAPLPSPEYGLLALSGVLLSFINAMHLSQMGGVAFDGTALRAAEYAILCKSLA